MHRIFKEEIKLGVIAFGGGDNVMKKQGCLFMSAIAAVLVAIAGKPAAADICLTQPNVRADGGHWYYRIDRPRHRKCWYQQPSRREARSATSSPPSSAAAQAPSTSPSSANSYGLHSWLSSIGAALTGKAQSIAAQDEEAHVARSAEPAPRRRLRAARQGDADRSHSRRATVEQLRAKQVDPDNFRAMRAESDSRRPDVDQAVLRAAPEDQDSFRAQSNGANNARARAKSIDQEDSRTRINSDNGRGAQANPDNSPLNRFDWDGVQARSATSLTKGDSLQSKAVPTATVGEPLTRQAPPQVSKAGVSALDGAQREALFQEFLRWQERQSLRFR